MKARVILAAAVGISLLGAPPASAQESYERLEVSPNNGYCFDEQPTCTVLQTNIASGDGSWTITLTRIGGANLPLSTWSSGSAGTAMGGQTETGALSTGSYELRISQWDDGGWWCGWTCHYSSGGETTDLFRFKYVAGRTMTFGAYRSPTTRFVKLKSKALNKPRRVFTGRLVGQVERSDFTLTANAGLRGRKVILTGRVKGKRKEIRLGVGRTTRSGNFRIVSKTKRQIVSWTVRTPEVAGSPAASDGRQLVFFP